MTTASALKNAHGVVRNNQSDDDSAAGGLRAAAFIVT